MNAIISQTLCCLVRDRWEGFFPTVEKVVNSLLNRSTGYSPFFLMHGYHLVLPIELLKGNESTDAETLSKFLERMQKF